MEEYDPEHPLDPGAWLELDESERIALVKAYHRRARIRLPNVQAHSTIHAIVENQLALDEPEVVAALARLCSEGLVRHDAIHAIGQVLATTIHEGLTGSHGADRTASYGARLRSLTAQKWLDQEID